MTRHSVPLALGFTAALLAACGASNPPWEQQEDGGCRPPCDVAADDGRMGDRPDVDRDDGDAAFGNDDGDVPLVPLPPVCGDGNVDFGEECDDGNRMNDDGCDWQCRVGNGSFDYPPADPSVPPIAPGSPLVRLAVPGPDGRGGPVWPGLCGNAWITWGPGGFGVVYDVAQPYYAVRFLLVDVEGVLRAEPWEYATPWTLWRHALAWTGSEYALFSSPRNYVVRLALTRFDGLGTPLDEFRTVLDRTPEPGDASSYDMSAAGWIGDRHAVAADPGSEEAAEWIVHTVSREGDLLASVLFDFGLGRGPCLSIVPLPGGFAVTDGISIVVLDGNLRVAGWSGHVDASGAFGAVRVVGADGNLLLVWSALAVGGVEPRYGVWLAGFDPDGAPLFPPREILADVPRPMLGVPGVESGYGLVTAAWGSAGLGILYLEGMPGGIDEHGARVRIVNTDFWGNLRSEPAPVLPDDAITPAGLALDIAASDTGYGVVAGTAGAMPGTFELVFRHYVPSP